MCQGIRDAVNLCWKLIDRMNGLADDHVLDSYEQERASHVRELTGRIKAIGQYISERDIDLARARDARLRAEGGGKALTVTRQEIVPPLREGFLHTPSGEAAGALFPQPWVETASGPMLLDKIAGSGWRLVMFGVTDPAAFDLSQRATRLGVTPVLFGAGSLTENSLIECEGVLQSWFERNGACAALVRPDHYTFGIAADAVAAINLLESYKNARQNAA